MSVCFSRPRWFALFLLPVLSGCHLSGARTEEFRNNPIRGEVLPDPEVFPANAASLVPREKIQVVRKGDGPAAPWEISFHGLTDAESAALRELYSGYSLRKSQVAAGRAVYTLTDFLPPVVQALEGHTFRVEKELLEGPAAVEFGARIRWLHTSLNCWSTAWEIARLAKTPAGGGADDAFSLFGISGPEILPRLREDRTTTHIQGARTELPEELAPLYWPERNAKLQTGDLLLISHLESDGREMLEHVATFVDHDIYFEKTALNDDAPLRIVKFSDMIERFKGTNGRNTHLEWRRPTAVPFAHPRAAFGSARQTSRGIWFLPDSGSSELAHRVFPLEIEVVSGERARLPEKFLKSGTFSVTQETDRPVSETAPQRCNLSNVRFGTAMARVEIRKLAFQEPKVFLDIGFYGLAERSRNAVREAARTEDGAWLFSFEGQAYRLEARLKTDRHGPFVEAALLANGSELSAAMCYPL